MDCAASYQPTNSLLKTPHQQDTCLTHLCSPNAFHNALYKVVLYNYCALMNLLFCINIPTSSQNSTFQVVSSGISFRISLTIYRNTLFQVFSCIAKKSTFHTGLKCCCVNQVLFSLIGMEISYLFA